MPGTRENKTGIASSIANSADNPILFPHCQDSVQAFSVHETCDLSDPTHVRQIVELANFTHLSVRPSLRSFKTALLLPEQDIKSAFSDASKDNELPLGSEDNTQALFVSSGHASHEVRVAYESTDRYEPLRRPLCGPLRRTNIWKNTGILNRLRKTFSPASPLIQGVRLRFFELPFLLTLSTRYSGTGLRIHNREDCQSIAICAIRG
jgi:hypothetical protein